MIKTRVIPCLLLKNNGLVKTRKFNNPKYLGDPINIVKIFNDKEVDEIIFLDITATKENRGPNYSIVSDIASECFMPLSYGGGIKNIEEIRTLLKIGVEKVALNTSAVTNPALIKEAADLFGSSTIIASIDVKQNLFGKYEVFINGGTRNTKIDPVAHAKQLEQLGVGEILINSIDRDGVMKGYDLEIIKRISNAVEIPVVACGGAGTLQHLKEAVELGNASAVAAGSIFVYKGPHNAVLISYPSQSELKSYLK